MWNIYSKRKEKQIKNLSDCDRFRWSIHFWTPLKWPASHVCFSRLFTTTAMHRERAHAVTHVAAGKSLTLVCVRQPRWQEFDSSGHWTRSPRGRGADFSGDRVQFRNCAFATWITRTPSPVNLYVRKNERLTVLLARARVIIADCRCVSRRTNTPLPALCLPSTSHRSTALNAASRVATLWSQRRRPADAHSRHCDRLNRRIVYNCMCHTSATNSMQIDWISFYRPIFFFFFCFIRESRRRTVWTEKYKCVYPFFSLEYLFLKENSSRAI